MSDSLRSPVKEYNWVGNAIEKLCDHVIKHVTRRVTPIARRFPHWAFRAENSNFLKALQVSHQVGFFRHRTLSLAQERCFSLLDRYTVKMLFPMF